MAKKKAKKKRKPVDPCVVTLKKIAKQLREADK